MTVSEASAVPPLPPGSSPADGIELLGLLARGHDLDVHEAWDESRACPVVVKLARPDRAEDSAVVERLRLEGERLRVLGHPHLVRAYETLEGTGGPVVVLETLGGETLSHRIADRGRPVTVAELAWLGLHLASALQYLHAQGLLHLDLKSSNVIDDRGLAKLIDLSLARPPGKVPAGLGTPEYLAPEQARGGEAGPETDVWGLGGVLYAAATGRRPFRAPAPGGSFEQLRGTAGPVSQLRALPADLAASIDGCLTVDAAARPTLEDLAAVLDGHAPDA